MAFFKVRDAIAEIEKPGPVFVMARLTQHDEHSVQVVKVDLLNTLREFLAEGDEDARVEIFELESEQGGRMVGW